MDHPPRTSGTFDRKSGHEQYDPEEEYDDDEYDDGPEAENGGAGRRPANRRRWTPSSPSHVLSSDPELEGLGLYDKKCVLINREIDAMGMGRYQWMIWGLCGFGYLLDLLWAQAFGLALSPLQQELGFGDDRSGNISTAFNAGLTAGAFFWGALSDVVGMFGSPSGPLLSSPVVAVPRDDKQYTCRKWAFNLTCLFSSVFGLCLGASNNFTTFLVLTAFVGFGVGGNIPIDTTITLEFIPQNKRFLLATLSIFQPIGVVICSAIAFGFIPTMSCSPNFSEPNPLPSCNDPTRDRGAPCCGRDNNQGWRYLLFTLGAITLAVFFLRCFVFRFRESPKFLVYKGRDEEAIKVVHHIANTNGAVCRLSLDHFEALSGEGGANPRRSQPSYGGGGSGGRPGLRTRMSSTLGRTVSGTVTTIKRMKPSRKKVADQKNRYMMLFSSFTMARLTILVWLTYIFDFWGFTVAGFYLPRILAIKNGAASEGNSLSFTYASYIYTYAPGAVGVLLGSLMYRLPSFGRKWTMTVSSGLMGASILLFSIVDTVPKNLGMFTMEYFFQSMFNAVLYGWTPEAFPAPVRGTACGLASFWGRLFGIVSPLIAQHLYGSSTSPGGGGDVNAVLYLAGGVTLGCVVTTALLPNKALQSSDGRS